MKAVILAPLPPPAGGIAGWTARMLKAKLKNGWEIRVVDEKVIGKRGVFGKKSRRNYVMEIKRCFRIWKGLRDELRDKDVKVVHSCIPSIPFAMIRECICAWITKKSGRKFIIHYRCTVPNTSKGRISHAILRLLCQKSDMIISLNNQSESFLDRITSKPIVTIPNFIEESEIVSSHRVKDSVKRVLYVGGIVKDKGVLDLIQVAKSFPDIEFRVVGEGDQSIVQSAYEMNISNVVFTGPKTREEVKKEMEEADVFMFLTFFFGEGFSNALCEAMAAGLPCIVTDWAANRDMVGEEGGIVIDVNDVDGAVDALNSINSRETREKMSQANIRKVREKYLDQIVLDQYVEAYEQIQDAKKR